MKEIYFCSTRLLNWFVAALRRLSDLDYRRGWLWACVMHALSLTSRHSEGVAADVLIKQFGQKGSRRKRPQPPAFSSGVVTSCATPRASPATITDQEYNQDLRLLALEWSSVRGEPP
ncbi:hypothetical protein LshimejAT787_1800720 [Lyophyllum shimeji]|uniref:Uncharacterized protein n=1 Tax=Lyophyllum shimeji TaxID=47721 RepID=A0A9P3PZ96_LYOSH|nr:hypothetical protein LshimejAT787_1800720 [Lyophyllum shimeji]